MKHIITIIKKYYKFFKNYKLTFVILIFSTVLASVTQFMSPFYLGKIIDAIGKKSFIQVKQYISIIIVFFAITIFFSIIETYISSFIEINIKTILEKHLFDRLINSRIEVLDTLKGAEIINRLEDDTHSIASFYITKLSDYIIEAIKLIISIILLMIISIKLSSIALVLVPLNFISTIILGKKTQLIQKQAVKIKDRNRAFIQEAVSGIREIKNLVIEKEVTHNFHDYMDLSKKLSLKQTIIITMSNSLNSIASFGINLILILYSGWMIIESELTLGSFVAFSSYLGYFLASMQKIWNIPIDVQSLKISDERINEILQYEIEEYKEENNDTEIDGDIIFKDIKFKYNNSDKLVINNFNLEIKANSLTAIIGENGAGKTTILNLLNRFYSSYSGNIYVGEKDIKEFNLKVFRKNITYIQQNVFFFNKSIRDNLLIGTKNVSEDELIKACKEVNIHDYIESLPNRYDTIIENDGKLLSGGQKQKLGIVRGILRNTPIFLFDEANKGLDIDSTERLVSTIKKLSKNHIVIMISHDKNIFKEADTVINIENGTAIEKI